MTLPETIAYMVMGAGGIALGALCLGAACWLLIAISGHFWRRMRRLYRLATVWHYLAQLEKTGRYHFPPPDKDNP